MRRYWFFIVGLAFIIVLLILGIFNLSGDNRITSFWFAEEDNPSLQEDIDGIIEGNVIQVTLTNGDNVDQLIPTFTHTGKRVTIDGVKQVSKKTANDFSSEIVYTVTASNGSKQDYTILVYIEDERGIRPPLPAPHTFEDAIPQKSQELLVEQTEITNIDFAPIVDSVIAETRVREEKNIFTGKWKVSQEADLNKEIDLTGFTGLGDRRIQLIADGQIVTDSNLLQIRKKIPNKLLIVPQREHYTIKPLQEKPRLQVVRYWVLADPEAGVSKLAPNEGASISTQVKVGVYEGSRKSFAPTIGAVGDREVELFNLLVNSQFDTEYLPNERSAGESILPVQETVNPADYYQIAAVYKLVQEFRLVNASGQPYTDPNYQFDPASLKPLIYVDSRDVVTKVYTFKRYKP